MSQPEPSTAVEPGLFRRLLCTWIFGGLLIGAVMGSITQAHRKEVGESPARWVTRRAVTTAIMVPACGLVAWALARPARRVEVDRIVMGPFWLGAMSYDPARQGVWTGLLLVIALGASIGGLLRLFRCGPQALRAAEASSRPSIDDS